MKKAQKSATAVEGEGSYSATRQYSADLGKWVESGQSEGAAVEAARAVDGPEGKALREAEMRASSGPRKEAGSKSPPPKKKHK